MLAAQDSLRLVPEPRQAVVPRPSREDTVALPKCTTEGIGYVKECWPCRLQGRKTKYIGEKSRSAYQRAGEHWKEIQAGKKTHPVVEHFLEHHQGTMEEVLLQTLGMFQTALQRQVWE